MQNKVCNTCKIEKDPSSFYKKGNSLYFECKECAIRRTKEIRKRKHPVNLKTELGNTYLLEGVWKCARCGETKPLSKFGKYKGNRHGHNYTCLECCNKEALAYRRKKGRIAGRTRRIGHKILDGVEMKYCSSCNSYLPLSEFSDGKGYCDGLAAQCRVCSTKRTATWVLENPEKVKLARENTKARYKSDINLRLNRSIASALSRVIAGRENSYSSTDYFKALGYSIEDLKTRLSSTFRDGMSWNNYGSSCGQDRYWEIDHIVSKSLFRFTSTEDDAFQKCWALENLRALWYWENRSRKFNIKEIKN